MTRRGKRQRRKNEEEDETQKTPTGEKRGEDFSAEDYAFWGVTSESVQTALQTVEEKGTVPLDESELVGVVKDSGSTGVIMTSMGWLRLAMALFPLFTLGRWLWKHDKDRGPRIGTANGTVGIVGVWGGGLHLTDRILLSSRMVVLDTDAIVPPLVGMKFLKAWGAKMDYETLQMRLCLPDRRKCTIKWQEKGSGLLTLPVRPGRASLAVSGKLGRSSLDIQSLTDTATGEEVVVSREVIFREWKERRRETGACGKKLWAGCVQKETQAHQSVESLGEGIMKDEAFVGSQRRGTKRVTFRETVSDNGSHFKGVFDLQCRIRGISHEWTPVGHPQSMGILENRHYILDTQITLLHLERDIPEENWQDVLPTAVALINRMPAAREPYLFAYKRMTGVCPVPASIEEKRRSHEEFKGKRFEESEMVLFRHLLRHYGKSEEEWKPGEVVKVISPTLFRIRPIRERDRGYESYEVDLFVTAIQPMPEELQQELRKPGGVLENEPSAAEKEKEKRKRSDGKKFIIWKDEKTKQLFLGEVKEEKRGRVTVQHYGLYGKGALRDRLYRPAVKRKEERAVMFTNNTKKYGAVEPDLFEVEREDIVIENAEVEKNGRLGESMISTLLREYIEEKEFALSTEPEDRMSGSGVTSFLNSLISMSSFFCSDQEVGRVLLTETTHQKVKYGSLTPEMKKKCDEARRAELAKLMKYDTYDTVRKENIPAGATVLDMLVVDTLKMKAGGEREFKARAVARGD
uniref:Integrase catalytic domain-containing protein n=1 Tax=Chromera velia CCMP2878 TaxID=1169474 RepID=A0A0G4IAI6_9ALVE|eukprot:Cvel_12540.t1-p1 / transcript=Cvel_12540.t1 / gene=Cvel_12540 / organism=Chromera_velia_CCMP2878 / gene_product=hypothetical protein / transcript_product=hypothetical protein / location=Cvel_scaffold824:8109-11448(+) / protein_length=745 / sequence_SO=supercontig / SO=protein_coding / is_pseudo=false